MRDSLQARWERVMEDMRRSPQRRYLSPDLYAQYQAVLPLMRRYINGKMIDLGCGDMPFREFLMNQVTIYHSLDVRARSDEVTYVGDIGDMPMVASASYDSAICLQVLEHVPNPFQAMREIHRILKPNGILIVSVPHLSRLHDEPHDYFRFTIYGLRHLLESTGFEVLEIQKRGGLFSFLGHQLSILLLSATWPLAGLRQIAWLLNKWGVTRLCYGLDSLFDDAGLFALGYVAVVRKTSVGQSV